MAALFVEASGIEAGSAGCFWKLAMMNIVISGISLALKLVAWTRNKVCEMKHCSKPTVSVSGSAYRNSNNRSMKIVVGPAVQKRGDIPHQARL